MLTGKGTGGSLLNVCYAECYAAMCLRCFVFSVFVKEKQSFSAGQVEWQLGWGHFGSRLLPLCCFHGGGGCPSRAAMFPAVSAALAMETISDMTAHFRVEAELWSAFTQEVGATGDDPRLLAALPGKLVAAALSQASLPGGRPLSAVQAAQVGLVWKLARRIMYTKGGGLWEDWTEEDPWDAPSTTSPSKRTATSSKKDDKDTKERTLKFTQVLDQGDDGEFEVLTEDDKLLLLQKYINTTGSMPEEEEEPTIEQLSALKKKLSLGKPPYADFGVYSSLSDGRHSELRSTGHGCPRRMATFRRNCQVHRTSLNGGHATEYSPRP